MKRTMASCRTTKMWIDGQIFEIKRLKKNCEGLSGESDNKYAIQTNADGKLFTSFRLPQPYFVKLEHFPHLDLKLLESKTNTSISIPKSGNMVISGDSTEKIVEARDEIHTILGQIRQQSLPLQFVSIPTRSDEIMGNFIKFRDGILNGEKMEGMEDSIFQSPYKLHLTIVLFTLLDETEKLEAIRALEEFKTTTFEPTIRKRGPVKIKISGIDCMDKNLKKVNVLYANAQIINDDEEFNLQKIANELGNHFYNKGLVRQHEDNVKLHMTLINSKYRKSSGSPNKKRWVKRQPFDATTIMDKYKHFYFGESEFNCIHLSLMSAGGVEDDGFYKAMSVISVE